MATLTQEQNSAFFQAWFLIAGLCSCENEEGEYWCHYCHGPERLEKVAGGAKVPVIDHNDNCPVVKMRGIFTALRSVINENTA